MATTLARRADKVAEADMSEQSRRVGELYYPMPKQWASLTTEPVTAVIFRTEHLTEGKIAVDEDRATLVYSPYAGRVTKLFAKPGDRSSPVSRCSWSRRPTWCRRRTISSPPWLR